MTITRRHFMRGAAAAGAAALLPGCGALSGGSRGAAAPKGEPIRFAHLSDIHIMPEKRGVEGFAQCLQRVHAIKPRPRFILTGGDLAHDARNADPQRANRLYDLFHRVMRDSDIPFRHCVGNHDCFGWGPRSPIDPGHEDYGKKLFRDRMELDELTYAFDVGRWRVCVVDNILPTRFDGKRGYQGGFTEEAIDFVDRQFRTAADRPKLICTHIPIVSATALSYSEDVEGKLRPMPTSLVTRNSKAILALLERHRVELILTGHLHQSERVAYQHTTHIGQGAVCGQWWRGPNAGTAEGFGVVDLWPDGQWRHGYETFGWEASV